MNTPTKSDPRSSSYTVIDKRGGKQAPGHQCRICGSETTPDGLKEGIHTLRYDHPTMACVTFFRDRIKVLTELEDDRCRSKAYEHDA